MTTTSTSRATINQRTGRATMTITQRHYVFARASTKVPRPVEFTLYLPVHMDLEDWPKMQAALMRSHREAVSCARQDAALRMTIFARGYLAMRKGAALVITVCARGYLARKAFKLIRSVSVFPTLDDTLLARLSCSSQYLEATEDDGHNCKRARTTHSFDFSDSEDEVFLALSSAVSAAIA